MSLPIKAVMWHWIIVFPFGCPPAIHRAINSFQMSTKTCYRTDFDWDDILRLILLWLILVVVRESCNNHGAASIRLKNYINRIVLIGKELIYFVIVVTYTK